MPFFDFLNELLIKIISPFTSVNLAKTNNRKRSKLPLDINQRLFTLTTDGGQFAFCRE